LTPTERSPLASEWQAMGEWAQLLANPVYWGVGVPRGRGRLVLVIPGLFGNDLYLHPLRTWLGRLGYRPVRSTLSINAGCYERLSGQAEEELRRAMSGGADRVAVIGHSRGGMLARAIAARLGGNASHLILLGSPAGAFARMSQAEFERGDMPPGASAVVGASLRARRLLDPDCRFPACGCPFAIDLRRPLSPQTQVLSVYSRDDAVVPPSASPMPGARNVEVGGTHSGLVYNQAAYRELAAALASE